MTSTKDVDARSDIWALGVVLYELLAAHAPFDGETLPQVCSRVMRESPASLVAIAPGIQRGLAAIVSRCLEKLPDERYQTVAELATALAPYGTLTSFQSVERIQRLQGAQEFLLLAPEQGLPTVAATAARVPTVAPGAVKALGTQTNWGESEIPGLQRSRLPWLLGVVAVVAACGAGIFLKVARHNDPLGHRAPTVAHAPAPVSAPPTAMTTEPRLAASAAHIVTRAALSATSAPLPEPAAVEQSRSAKAPVTDPNPGTKVRSKKSAPPGSSAASPSGPEIAPVSAPALVVAPPPPVVQPPVVQEAPASRSRF